jgi:hypothetical protein
MRTFKDNAGRTWSLTLSVWTVKKVRDLLGVDLLDLGGESATGSSDKKPGLLFRLIADPVLLVMCCTSSAGTRPTRPPSPTSSSGAAWAATP